MYRVVNPPAWNVFVPLYIFFKGLSVGAFVISVLSTVFGVKSLKPLAWPAAAASVVSLALVPVMLLADLGQPGRIWHLYVPAYFNPSSPLAWGSWLLVIYPILLLWYTYLTYQARSSLMAPADRVDLAASEAAAARESGMPAGGDALRVAGMAVLPVAVAADSYTGFLLGVVKGNALWNSALLPAYLLASAVLSGAALIAVLYVVGFGCGRLGPGSPVLSTLGRIMLGAIAVELFFAISQWIVLGMASTQGRLALKLLFADPLYLWGEVIAGLIVPLVILISPKARENATGITAAAILAIIGSFLMRYTLIFVGLQAARLIG